MTNDQDSTVATGEGGTVGRAAQRRLRRAPWAGASQRRRRRARRATCIAAATALALGSNGLALAALQGSASAAALLGGSPTKLLPSTSVAEAATVAADVGPAIVDVNTTLAQGAGTAAGTGMVLTSDGYIVTNNHVVEEAVKITVTIPGRGTYNASVVGLDVGKDVALLKVSGVSGLTTVRLSTVPATVGMSVVAIGNALGKGGTPSSTAGSLAALGQQITAATDLGSAEQLTGMLEADVPIEPGDSGGPLLDAEGEVIGMDTAGQETMADEPSDVAYSVPISTVVSVVEQIMAGKSGNGVLIGATPFLGVEVSQAQSYGHFGHFGGFGGPGGAASSPVAATGLLVQGVVSGSAAAKAGLQAGDELISIDGQAVTSSSQLESDLLAHKVGTAITIKVMTPSGEQTVQATLGSGPVA